ncbi:response regulator transcription factor [Methylomonas paludis]|uniref:Response regulator transcription factor n=1 Tax=Methylomonas paludis TaxID=1173101 RepID=A0A975MLI1_9GAMM|nr:response regulator transcription factor [Methylomonas paludis]QWF70066.1 response regulator transcription factor [Methylomonas paludis]
MNVLLIEDHFCAREGVANLLKQLFADIQVSEAETIDQGLAIAESVPLSLVLLDVNLPGKDGLIGLKLFRQQFPNLCMVMFSGFDDKDLVLEALGLGAMGFISKNLPRVVFVEALQDVLAGKLYLPVSIINQSGLALNFGRSQLPNRHRTEPQTLGLTVREFEVLAAVVQGKSNKLIARQLGIQEQTVKNHLRPVFLKLGVVRRTELLVKVFEMGVVFGRPEVGNNKL